VHSLLADAGQGALGAVKSYMRGDLGGVATSLFGVGKKIMGGQDGATEKIRRTKTSPADVISLSGACRLQYMPQSVDAARSGCKDNQTSADTQEAGQATGAMSFALIAALSAASCMARGLS
jgi:hypothetical protein